VQRRVESVGSTLNQTRVALIPLDGLREVHHLSP
jgi:hypothetical protein